MTNRTLASWTALSVLCVAACSEPAAPHDPPPTTSDAACSVQRCGADGACDRFTPAGDLVDGTGIPAHQAPQVPRPDVPLIQRRVRLGIDPPPAGQQGHYLAPVIPAWRASNDGRIALVDGAIRPVELESLEDAPISKQPANLGATIFGTGVTLAAAFGDTSTGGFLCTPDGAEPYPCPNYDGQDCYDLVLVRRDDPTVSLWSTPLHVRVASPKTAAAHVVAATIGTITKVPLPGFKSSGEMLPTADGHLVTMRIHNGGEDGGAEALTYEISGGQTVNQPISLVYAYAKDACDISEWLAATSDGTLTSIRPWPAAYYDSRLHDASGHARYGIAARPLRDAGNHVLAETDVLPGSYPWLDREGNNLVFSTVDPQPVSSNPQQPSARFPMSDEQHALEYVETAPRGYAVIGAWTQGKEVLLDDMLDNEDYGFDPDDTHDLVLYDAAGTPIAVRVNGGSNNGVKQLNIPDANGNNAEIESEENRFAMHRAALPVTPRDVVWTIARGLASDEVPFDDYLNPNVVLFAPMNASEEPIVKQGVTNARNGLLLDGFPASTDTTFSYDWTAVRLQNAAASPLYLLAAAGRLTGPGRVEPVALGGVTGRGLWLDTGVTAAFHIPADPAKAGTGFFASVFVDARDSLAGAHPVMTFQAASGPGWSLSIAGGTSAVIDDGQAQHAIDISCQVTSWKLRWHHLGVLFEGTHATLYVDGDAIAKVPLARAVSLDGEGSLVIGGIRGWYDEARIELDGEGRPLSTRPAPELLCNAAHGTMVDDGGVQRCATDYTRDLGVGRGLVPQGTTSLRDSILMGDAPLYWDQPRPDSTARPFCLTCHVDASVDPGRPVGLTYEALQPGTVPAYQDPRTQPLQPPSSGPAGAQAFGNLPAQWIEAPDHQRYPAQDETGPTAILRWVLPHSPSGS